jgi:hypothetical protein
MIGAAIPLSVPARSSFLFPTNFKGGIFVGNVRAAVLVKKRFPRESLGTAISNFAK